MTGINKGKLSAPRNPNGRIKGKPNKATIEFKEAVTNLINYAAPEMVEWLKEVAQDDKSKALEHIYKMAQFSFPLLARTEGSVKHSGKIEFAWKE